MTYASIDDVLERLDAIVDEARRHESRLGYFPALYRNVTQRVKEGVESGRFEDAERMVRLDVVFAARYFDAYDCIASGRDMSACWRVSFGAIEQPWPLVLHHLLLGMNAHINLDLGVAAAEVCPGEAIVALERDFREINALLISMVEDVQDRLGTISPFLWLLDRTGGYDELLSRAGLRGTRGGAWIVANRLAHAHPEDRAAVIADVDRAAATFARALLSPGPIRRTVIRIIGAAERRSVPQVIDALSATK